MLSRINGAELVCAIMRYAQNRNHKATNIAASVALRQAQRDAILRQDAVLRQPELVEGRTMPTMRPTKRTAL
jgi:hypothetical protein